LWTRRLCMEFLLLGIWFISTQWNCKNNPNCTLTLCSSMSLSRCSLLLFCFPHFLS
jgi:hypothetical protein